MKRCYCFLTVLLFVFLTTVPGHTQNLEKMATLPSSFRPLTNEELLTFKERSFKQKLGFMTSYYLENKMSYNATDEAILNEMIKLDPQLAITVLKANQNVKKGMETFKEYYKEFVADINVTISEQYPDKPEYLIDPNDFSTLKNLSHLTKVGGLSLDFFDAWSDSRSFSEQKKEEYGQVKLFSCARRKEEPDILMGLYVRLNSNHAILYQKEGEIPLPISADYSESENMTARQVWLPVLKKLESLNASGYKGTVLFPFTASVVDTKNPAILKASFSFTVCDGTACSVKKTPLLIQDFPKETQLQTKICYEIINQKSKIPEFDDIDASIEKVLMKRTEEGTFLFALVRNSFLNFEKPLLRIDNVSGLRFSNPIFSLKDNQILFRSKLLNPDNLKLPLKLTLTLNIADRASVKTIEISEIQAKEFLFAPTFLAYLSTFLLGLKFLFATPLLTVLTLLVFQAGFAETASKEATKNFLKGVAAVASIASAIAFFAVIKFDCTWGNQFSNPYLNFVFMLTFACMPFAYFFMLEKLKRNMQTAGEGICLISVLLLIITPQFQTFFDVGTVIQTQKIFGYILFLSGISVPFFLIYGFRNKIIPKPLVLTVQRKFVFCIADIFQCVLFCLIIGIQTNLESFVLLVILLTGGFALLLNEQTEKRIKTFIPVVILLSGLFFLPFKATSSTFPEFSDDILTRALNEGKTVYVNVSNPACLLCRYNLWQFSITRKKTLYKPNDMLITQAGLDNAKIKSLLEDTENYALPANILFSPKYKDGFFLPKTLSREKIILGLKEVFSAND